MNLTKTLCSTLCAALILTAPGPFATDAAAAVIRAKVAPMTTIPGGAAPMPLGAGLEAGVGQNINLVNPLLGALPSVGVLPNAMGGSAHIAPPVSVAPGQLNVHPAVVEKAPLKSVVAGPGEEVAARAEKVRTGARRTLSSGVEQIERSKGIAGRFSALKALFTGSRKRSGSGALVAADGLGETAPTPGLSRLGLAELEAVAVDSTNDPKERQSAVAAVAKRGGAEAQAALNRIAEANTEGGAADYEIHRAARKSLAEDYGELKSLRPVSRAHADEILKKLESDKPEEAFFDYDDTLADFNQPVSKEIGEGLRAAADAGVEPIILTDRPDVKKRERDVTIVDSLSTLTLAQKRAITLVSSRGTRTLLYNSRGEPVLVREEAGDAVHWTAAERPAILGARQAFLDRYGYNKDGTPVAEYEYNGQTHELSDYSYAHFLPLGWSEQAVREAAGRLQAELNSNNVPYTVTPRVAKNPEKDPPYLTISKIDKRTGVLPLRANRRAIEVAKDFLRFGSKRLAKTVWNLSGFFGKRPVGVAKTLSVGDQFFDMRTADMGFVKGSPGSLVISVGRTADPRLENIFVWPTEGRTASLEILQALGRKAPSEMNKKAVVGLFAQRTASIAVFILSTIAYPFIAVPIVGWGGYGALMAFGPLAAIATGPLNGIIVDRLSARNAMALNTVVRVVLALVLPVMAAFGVLNFWTLFVASIANGWLLSSVMTTEGAYVKRLAGAKNVGAVNGLLWMNYLFIQVLLGLIVGIGSLVDAWNPMIAFYLVAAVNAAVVLPIIWWTMPNFSPAPKTQIAEETAAIRGRREKAAKLGALRPDTWSGFLRKNAKPLAAFAASVGLYLLMSSGLPLVAAITAALPVLAVKFLSSTIPLIAALVYWITTLDSFKSLWYGRGGEPSAEQKALEDKLAGNEKAIAEGAANADALRAENKKLRAQLRIWQNRLRSAVLFIALSALLMYPLQYYGLPNIAQTLVGAQAKGLLLGQLLGSLFFGNLIANAATARLAEIRLPLIGRITGQRLIQAAVAALAAAWVYTGLVPGSILAALGAAAAAAVMIALASKLTDRGWLKLYGVGFGAIWLPYLAWTTGLLPISVPAAMMLSLLSIGMFYGPGFVSLISYFHRNAAQGNMGKAVGVQGSLFNAAISLGYGAIALGASLFIPAFPALLLPLGIAYAIGGLLFWFAPDRLPGFPKTLFHPKDKK